MSNAFERAQLAALKAQEETGLTLAELAALPLDEWARLTCGQTPAEAAIAAFNAEQNPAPQQQAPAPAQTQAAEPMGVDPNSQEYFRAWRAERKSGGEGKGIFDSVDSQSPEYVAAAHAEIGRTGYSQSNVQEAPRLTNRYLNHDEHRDTRSLQARFSTPGNAFGA
jgi:hypothetical protein